MRKKYVIAFLLIYICLLFSGCNSDNNFQTAYEQFKESYMKATDFFDLNTQDSFKALAGMDSDTVNSELKKMNDALNTMKDDMKTEDQKKLYTVLKEDYEDIEYLLSIHDSLDKLSVDEKIAVGNKMTNIFIMRDDYKRKEN